MNTTNFRAVQKGWLSKAPGFVAGGQSTEDAGTAEGERGGVTQTGGCDQSSFPFSYDDQGFCASARPIRLSTSVYHLTNSKPEEVRSESARESSYFVLISVRTSSPFWK
jgi:hypothetical protein